MKQQFDRLAVDSIDALNKALTEFRFFYNHVRPHRNLGGAAPAEAWAGVDPYASRTRDSRRPRPGNTRPGTAWRGPENRIARETARNSSNLKPSEIERCRLKETNWRKTVSFDYETTRRTCGQDSDAGAGAAREARTSHLKVLRR